MSSSTPRGLAQAGRDVVHVTGEALVRLKAIVAGGSTRKRHHDEDGYRLVSRERLKHLAAHCDKQSWNNDPD